MSASDTGNACEDLLLEALYYTFIDDEDEWQPFTTVVPVDLYSCDTLEAVIRRIDEEMGNDRCYVMPHPDREGLFVVYGELHGWRVPLKEYEHHCVHIENEMGDEEMKTTYRMSLFDHVQAAKTACQGDRNRFEEMLDRLSALMEDGAVDVESTGEDVLAALLSLN